MGRNVVLIPQFGDTTGHSDGVVSFIDTDVIAYSDLDSDDDNSWFEEYLEQNGVNYGSTFVVLKSFFNVSTEFFETVFLSTIAVYSEIHPVSIKIEIVKSGRWPLRTLYINIKGVYTKTGHKFRYM